jgi:Arc/MetJ family transcription regulator
MKHLVDIDEEALASARIALGTRTIKDTVNQALRCAVQREGRPDHLGAALDRLAQVDMTDTDRRAAWR